MTAIKLLQFPSRIDRFRGLRKLRKENPKVKILNKGKSFSRCCGDYYWASIEIET